MGSNADEKTFGDVLQIEFRDIGRRREKIVGESDELKAMWREVDSNCDASKDKKRIDELLALAWKSRLVGLALSGGGVRSGAVNLGLLQSLYRRQLLNQFDYMSTVSGGGYAGTYLTAMLRRFKRDSTVDWRSDEAPEEGREEPQRKQLQLALGKDRRQSGEIRRLIYGGVYLLKFRELASATIFGIVVNWAMILSGLTAIAALLAIIYRMFDMPAAAELPPTTEIPSLAGLPWSGSIEGWMQSTGMPAIGDIIESTTYAGDVPHALVPTLAVGGIWLMVLVLRIASKRLRSHRYMNAAQTWASMLLVASLLCALVLIINTGQVQLAPTSSAPRVDVTALKELQRWTWLILVAAIVITLLPFLRRNELARSGASSSPKWKGWMANTAAFGMLAGVPLVIFGIVVDEDLFQFNESRPRRFLVTRPHVEDWVEFSARVQRDASQTEALAAGPSRALVQSVHRVTLGPAGSSSWTFDRIIELEQVRRRVPRDYWLVGRWVRSLIDPHDGPVSRLYAARRESRELENEVAKQLNALLGDRCFYKQFPVVPPNPILTTLRSNGLDRSYASARATAAALALLNDPLSAAEQTEIEKANRALLDLWYLNAFLPPETVFSRVVWTSDQWNRLCILMWSTIVCLTLGLLVNVNVTSAHSYYRQRLSEMWMPDFGYGSGMRFSSMKNTAFGGPYHLINATVNLIGPGRNPREEPTESFLFSRRYYGSERVGYERAHGYSRRGSLTVADAMAISGAAVSPIAALNNLLLFYALVLTNARLGQWVRNPGNKVCLRYPTFLPAILSYFYTKPENAAYLYVSDGGHHDNTGIEPLLRRRCRVIVACDASWDPESQFLDLLRLFRRMSTIEGIEFSAPDGGLLDLDPIVPNKRKQLTKDHLVLVRISYPEHKSDDKTFAWLIYLKSSLCGKEKPELLRYRTDNADFPHDPTTDQFFDPRRFECYRELGFHLGERLREWIDENEPPSAGQSLAETLWLKDREFAQAAAPPIEALRRELRRAVMQMRASGKVRPETLKRIGELGLVTQPQLQSVATADGAKSVPASNGAGKDGLLSGP